MFPTFRHDKFLQIEKEGFLEKVEQLAGIVQYPIQQYVGEKEITELTLEVYYKEGTEDSILYEDANDGYDYKKGRFSLRNFKLEGKTNELIISQHKSGKFDPSYTTFELKLHGLPFKTVNEIEIDNEKIPFDSKKLNSDGVLIIDTNFTELHIIGA